MAATIAPFAPNTHPPKNFGVSEATKPSATNPPPAAVPDMQGRSNHLGRFLAQRLPMEPSIAHAFVSPLSFSIQSNELAGVAEVLSEVLHPKPLQNGSVGRIRKDQHEQLLLGCSTALAWIIKTSQWESNPCAQQMTLQAMLPMYLVRQDESWDKGFWHSLELLQRVATLLQWCQLLQEHGAKDWLTQETLRPANPRDALERAFQLSLESLSESYWNSVAKSVPSVTPKQPKSMDAHNEQSLWLLATQLANRTTKLSIPSQIRIGVISWERVLQHWERLLGLIQSSELLLAIEGPVTGEMGENASPSVVHPNASTASSKLPTSHAADHRLVEIRSSNDPQLSANLERLLDQCRRDQSILSLVVVKRLSNAGTEEAEQVGTIANWQSRFIDAMMRESQASDLRGFTTEAGELALVYENADRSDLSNWIRLAFSNMGNVDENRPVAFGELEPLVAGVAMVSEPTRAFKIEQLIDGAWRCLDGASIQGVHAVKTIQVY